MKTKTVTLPKTVAMQEFRLDDINWSYRYDDKLQREILILELPVIQLSQDGINGLSVARDSLTQYDGISVHRFDKAMDKFLKKEFSRDAAKMLAKRLKPL